MSHPKDFHVDMSMEQLGDYVVEELKKIKVCLSAFELLRVPTIRNTVLGAFKENVVPQGRPGNEAVGKTSSSQVPKDQG